MVLKQEKQLIKYRFNFGKPKMVVAIFCLCLILLCTIMMQCLFMHCNLSFINHTNIFFCYLFIYFSVIIDKFFPELSLNRHIYAINYTNAPRFIYKNNLPNPKQAEENNNILFHFAKFGFFSLLIFLNVNALWISALFSANSRIDLTLKKNGARLKENVLMSDL